MDISMREWFMGSWELEREINALMLAKEELMARCLGSASVSSQRVSGSKSKRNSAMESYIELSDKLNRRIDDLCDLKIAMIDVIAGLPESRMRAVLTERYVSCHTWETIAENMNTEVRNLYRIHTSAMRILEKEYAKKPVISRARRTKK